MPLSAQSQNFGKRILRDNQYLLEKTIYLLYMNSASSAYFASPAHVPTSSNYLIADEIIPVVFFNNTIDLFGSFSSADGIILIRLVRIQHNNYSPIERI